VRGAREAREEVPIETPEERLESLEAKARQCEEHGLMAELITFRIECLALSRLCFGRNDPEVIKAQGSLAEAYLASGLEKQAVEHASQALSRAKESEYPLEDMVQSAAFTVGRAFVKLGEYDNAGAALKEALRACKKKHGASALATCPILGAQAQLYAAQGRHQDVIATMTKVCMPILSPNPTNPTRPTDPTHI
jgi:tetratricopeptide (TPR) repeat protein